MEGGQALNKQINTAATGWGGVGGVCAGACLLLHTLSARCLGKWMTRVGRGDLRRSVCVGGGGGCFCAPRA